MGVSAKRHVTDIGTDSSAHVEMVGTKGWEAYGTEGYEL